VAAGGHGGRGLHVLGERRPAPRLCIASGTYLYSQPYTAATTTTTDDGAAITARYRSPYVNLNYIRRQRKWIRSPRPGGTVRESILTGPARSATRSPRDWATSLPTTGGGAKKIVKLGASVPAQAATATPSEAGR
jgi:hypothetical protein